MCQRLTLNGVTTTSDRLCQSQLLKNLRHDVTIDKHVILLNSDFSVTDVTEFFEYVEGFNPSRRVKILKSSRKFGEQRYYYQSKITNFIASQRLCKYFQCSCEVRQNLIISYQRQRESKEGGWEHYIIWKESEDLRMKNHHPYIDQPRLSPLDRKTLLSLGYSKTDIIKSCGETTWTKWCYEVLISPYFLFMMILCGYFLRMLS